MEKVIIWRARGHLFAECLLQLMTSNASVTPSVVNTPYFLLKPSSKLSISRECTITFQGCPSYIGIDLLLFGGLSL